VALQVLAELKRVLKEDAGLELNVPKTSVLPKGVSHQVAVDMEQNIIQTTPTLIHLSGDVTIGSFCPEGFVGIGVPIGFRLIGVFIGTQTFSVPTSSRKALISG
jgi:hypothetical protein